MSTTLCCVSRAPLITRRGFQAGRPSRRHQTYLPVSTRLPAIAGVETMPRGHLDATAFVHRWMLDEGDKAGCHETAGAHWLPGPRHLAHLNDPAGRDDLDATTGTGGDDLEGLHALPGIDQCFDSVTLHEANDTPRVPSPARASGPSRDAELAVLWHGANCTRQVWLGPLAPGRQPPRDILLRRQTCRRRWRNTREDSRRRAPATMKTSGRTRKSPQRALN